MKPTAVEIPERVQRKALALGDAAWRGLPGSTASSATWRPSGAVDRPGNVGRNRILRRRNEQQKAPGAWPGASCLLLLRPPYPIAAFTRSGVNGVWRSRTPVSATIALATAGAISGVAICPAPVGWLSVRIRSMCIAGTSFMRGNA